MKITVREMIEQLKCEDPDKELFFGGLEFYRLKDRGDCVQVEFGQTVFLEDGKVIVQNH